MKIYLDNGYLNMKDILTNKYPFVFMVGGRGTGKTYGTLQSLLEIQEAGLINAFMILRRTQKEAISISTNATSSFKKIETNTGRIIDVKPIRDGIYGYFNEDDKFLGYLYSLSTFQNLRGIDFPDVDIIFYDEFIPKKRAYVIKEECDTLFDMYETINRNRELEGENPCKLLACSNSNQLANRIFMGLNVIPQLTNIALNGGGTFYDNDRGLQIIILRDSPISEKKKETALYKLTKKTSYGNMALNNEFYDNDTDLIKPCNLNQYTLLTTITGIAIYKHKSKLEYYVCQYEKETVFSSSERDIEKFKNKYYYLTCRYIDGEIFFQNLLTKILFLDYNNLR